MTKRSLAVILAVVLIFSASVFAVAQQEEPDAGVFGITMEPAAAPGVAAYMLKAAGVPNNYREGGKRVNFVSEVARYMGPQTYIKCEELGNEDDGWLVPMSVFIEFEGAEYELFNPNYWKAVLNFLNSVIADMEFTELTEIDFDVDDYFGINVVYYGALPEEGKDNSGSINAAINAASPGNTVFIPEGTYEVMRTINLKSGITLMGAGQDKTVIVKKTDGSSASTMINGDRVTDVVVRDLTVDGDDNGTVSNAIGFAHSSNVLVNSVTIKDLGDWNGHGPHAIHFFTNVTDSEVSDCTILRIGLGSQWGAGIRSAHGSSRNSFLRNYIEDTGRGGILANNGSTDLIVRNNVVKGSGHYTEGLGIEIWGESHRAIVEDNVIDHWLSICGSQYNAIRRNVISDNSGVVKFIGLENATSANNNVFTDNIVDGGQQMGINISNNGEKHYIFWGHNTINNVIQWGMQVQGEAGGAMYNYFYKTDFLNTQNDNPLAWYPNDSGHGVRFNQSAEHFVFDTVRIENNGRLGVQLLNSSNRPVDYINFVNSTIRNNKGNAFNNYSEPYNAFELENTIVEGNGNDTIPLQKPFAAARPEAVINSPDTAKAGEAVLFDSLSSTAEGGDISYVLWDFNDGIPSSDFSTTHTYENPGTYRVTLVVWDELGRGAIQEKTITITE
jgi:PKD repeat protein